MHFHRTEVIEEGSKGEKEIQISEFGVYQVTRRVFAACSNSPAPLGLAPISRALQLASHFGDKRLASS